MPWRRFGLFAAVAAALVLVQPVFAGKPPAPADWPMYGADLGGARSNPGGPGETQLPLLHRLWRFDFPSGDVTGTPVESGGRVFAGSDSGVAAALDAATGHVLWTAQLGGPVNSSAAVAGNQVYFAVAKVGAPFLVALDARSGRVLWRTTLSDQPESDVYASPVFFGGGIIEGTSALFAELHDANPVVRGSVVKVDAGSGAVVWRTFTVAPGLTGGGVWATAAVDPATGLAYLGTGNAYQAPADPHTDAILAVSAASGAIVRFFQATPDDVWNATTQPTGPDYDFGASPQLFRLADGTPAVGEGQKSGVFWAFRRDTLQAVWQARVAPGSGLGGILGSTATDGLSFFGPATLPGEVWSLDRSGGLRWAEPSPEPIKWGSVSLSNGVLYAASSGGLLQTWDAATGLPLLSFPLGQPSVGGVSIARGTVLVATGTSFGTGGSVQAFGV